MMLDELSSVNKPSQTIFDLYFGLNVIIDLIKLRQKYFILKIEEE